MLTFDFGKALLAMDGGLYARNPSNHPQGQQKRNVQTQTLHNFQVDDKRGIETLLAAPTENLTPAYVWT